MYDPFGVLAVPILLLCGSAAMVPMFLLSIDAIPLGRRDEVCSMSSTPRYRSWFGQYNGGLVVWALFRRRTETSTIRRAALNQEIVHAFS